MKILIPLGWTRSNDPKGIPTYHPCRGGVLNCVTAAKRDNTQNYIMELTPIICSARGRSNGSWHSDLPHFQNLEIGGGITNSITSVQKDNMLIIFEPCTPLSSDLHAPKKKSAADTCTATM